VKRPSFQFYPGDWLHDIALRHCSVGARGLWIDMLCLMHQGSEYGYLKVNGKVILPPNLSRIVGATLSEVEGWLHELSEAGVYSIDDTNCIYSRRMIRDEEVRMARAEGGKKGGNPKLKKVDVKVNHDANLQPTPSSSSSSSSSSSNEMPPISPLQGELVASDEKPKRNAVELHTWLAEIQAAGEKAIPEDDSIFDYAEEVGIPIDYLRIGWCEFRDRMNESRKRYKDWRAAFRKYVRCDYLKLWALGGDGYYLTTAGKQAALVHKITV